MFIGLRRQHRQRAGASLTGTALGCATLGLTLLVGGVAVNLAGCGGSSGGSTGSVAFANVDVTFSLFDTAGAPANGTIVIAGRTITSAGTQAVVTAIAPGTYSVSFTINAVTTTASVVLGVEPTQRYVLVEGITGQNNAGVTLTGRVLLNSPTTAPASHCNAGSVGISNSLLIRVRDVNQPGEPIVASITKPDQGGDTAANQGRFVITGIPPAVAPNARTYRIEVKQVSTSTAPTSGQSGTFTVVPGQTTIPSTIEICANFSGTAPTP
jgi:hypothetical protein